MPHGSARERQNHRPALPREIAGLSILMPTLVLLPGMDGTGRLFAPLLAELEGLLPARVMTYPAKQALGYEALESLVRDTLPMPPYVLLGESFSGPIAISIAASRPHGLVGVVLACTFARNPRPLPAALHRLLARLPVKRAPRFVVDRCLLGAKPRRELRDRLDEVLAEVDGAVLAARLEAIARVDVTDRLEAIDVPVLSLVARHDMLVPRRASSDLARLAPRVREVVLDGPHALLQTHADAAGHAIVEFVSRLDASANAVDAGNDDGACDATARAGTGWRRGD